MAISLETTPPWVTEALEQVEAGLSYDAIGEKHGVSRQTVIRRLDELGDSAHARARISSAEAWMERGLMPLQEALSKGSDIDPSAARAYEQACARRAALRNPLYRDKQDVALSGDITHKIVIDDSRDPVV